MPASLKHLSQLIAERQARPELSSASVVLAKWPADQKYYSVEVLACDKLDRKCKVKFEDDTQCWAAAADLHIQLSLDGIEDEEQLTQQIVCCVCDDGVSKTPNEIVICDTCQQGYHLQCHNPQLNRIEAKLEDEEEEWNCVTCIHLLALPNADGAQSSQELKKIKKERKPKEEKVTLTKVKEEGEQETKPKLAIPPTTLEPSPPPTPPPSKKVTKAKAKIATAAAADGTSKDQKSITAESAKKPRKPRASTTTEKKKKVKNTKIKLSQFVKKEPKEQIVPMTSHMVDLVNTD